MTKTWYNRFLSSFTITAGLVAASMANAADAQTVRFAVDPYTTGSQIWVAADKGYFAEEQIDPDVTTFATGIEAIDAMIIGRADMAVGLDFPTVARARNGRLKVLAGIFQSKPGWHKLVVANDIDGPEDLAGRKVGIATGTLQHLVTIKYLENNGVDPEDVELVGFSSLVEIVSSIKAGRIDGSFTWADGTDKSIEDGKHHVLVDDSAAALKSSAYITATADFTEAHPDAVVGVLKALDKASAFIADNPDEAAAIIASHTKAPEDRVRTLLDFNEFKLALTPYEAAGFSAIADFVSRTMDFDVSFETAVDPSFLERAAPDAVTLESN